MKLKLLLSGLLLCVFSVSAQDVITMTDGTKIKAKVEEITDTAVKYRKHSNRTGPIYSVKLDAVSKIVYQNGETDLFNAPAETPVTAPVDDTPVATAEESRPVSAQQPETQLNEYELLKMAEMADLGVTSEEAAKTINKAKKYRRIAWIGGGVLVAAGIGIAFAWQYIGIPAVAAGAAWCVGWNIAANKQMKKARSIEAYSVPVIEGEMLRIGKNPLMGSINVIGDSFTRSRALGIGLSYSF